MRAEPSEERQLLAANEDVHRVDLDHVDALEHAAQVATVDPAGRSPLGETLSCECDAAGLGGG
jgi:hypothetical protein